MALRLFTCVATKHKIGIHGNSARYIGTYSIVYALQGSKTQDLKDSYGGCDKRQQWFSRTFSFAILAAFLRPADRRFHCRRSKDDVTAWQNRAFWFALKSKGKRRRNSSRTSCQITSTAVHSYKQHAKQGKKQNNVIRNKSTPARQKINEDGNKQRPNSGEKKLL